MGFSGSLEKMTVTAYRQDDYTQQVGTPFKVMINPEKYSHGYEICYTDPQAQGSPGGSPNFNKTPSETVSFELVFDGTGVVPTDVPGVVPYTGDGIAEQIATFQELAFSYDGKVHSPNYLKIVWGSFLFKGRLSKLEVSYTLFKPDGTPLRARAQITVLRYTNEERLAKGANRQSPDVSHLVTVQAGETLPLLCFRIYGDSAPYPQVARANDLTDFRRIPAGRELLFPPLAEGEAP